MECLCTPYLATVRGPASRAHHRFPTFTQADHRSASIQSRMLLLATSALASTLQVGADKPFATPCAASIAALDGDTIEIEAGTYEGDVCAWTASRLTIRGVGGFARLDAAGEASGGKAIWVIQGDDTTVEWVEFTGATVPDQNGAGIRQEGTNLTVDHCSFHDNEDGILAGDDEASDIVITHSEFDHNGQGDGQSHNLYINHVRSLTFAYNHSHRSYIGHDLKSRAAETRVLYNVLADEADGQGSYQIDIPNGGLAIVLGNVIEQGPRAENSGMVSFAAEGATNAVQALYVVNNTFVNDLGHGTFIRNAGVPDATVVNNLFVGGGTALDGPGVLTTCLETDASGLVDAANADYHLLPGSPAIDAGSDPGAVDGDSLLPAWEIGPDGEEVPRAVVGPLDLGAFEWGEPSDIGGGDDTGDSVAHAPEDTAEHDTAETEEDDKGSGCGCTAGGRGPSGFGLLLAAVLFRMRRRDGAGHWSRAGTAPDHSLD